MITTTFAALAALVALSVLVPGGARAALPIGPAFASRAKTTNVAGDAFRKGYRTRLEDAVEQSDLDESVRSYDRAAAGEIAEHDANIAASPNGYVAAGGQQLGRSGEFDRGVLEVNRSRTVRQAADVGSAGVDVGEAVDVRRSAAQIAKLPGVASTGAHTALDAVKRHQDMADVERVDQFAHEELLDEERYDRGVKNKAAASTATILNGGVASGASSADFAATRDRARYVNNVPGAGITVDTRHVAKGNRVVNDVASTKAAEGATVFAPLGAAGGQRALEDVRSHQAAVHTGVVHESHAFEAPIVRQLQSDWVKGNAASQAAIDAFAGAASGKAARQVAAGYDQADTQITIANRANRRTATESTEFDDRHGVRAADSKTVIL